MPETNPLVVESAVEVSKKSRAELELERLQRAVAELQAKVDAEAELLKQYGQGAQELAYTLHESFCDRCNGEGANNCPIRLAILTDTVDWADDSHQYWLKEAAKVADFLTSKGWQKPGTELPKAAAPVADPEPVAEPTPEEPAEAKD